VSEIFSRGLRSGHRRLSASRPARAKRRSNS
jgi:hypothetical protein